MSGPSPYDALFEIFGQEWETKKENHKRHMKIIRKSTKNCEHTKRKPSKIDNACQTHPLRDYSYNKIVNPSRRKVSSKIIHKEDVTINYSDDTIKEYKKQSSIGIHLKSSHVNALYKTVSDIEKLFRDERNLQQHSRKCLCNSCGALGVITESMKHPVDFGDESTGSEEESEEEEEEEEEEEMIPPKYNNSTKSWKIEYKDNETICRGPSQEGYIRLLVELERMIRRIRSLEQIALKHNIPIKRNKVDIAYDLQTNRLKNGVSRKLSSTSSSDVDRRQCKLFTIPDIIKRTFSRKKCTMQGQNNNKPPSLRSKTYQFKQNGAAINNAPRNTFTEAEKKYQAKCLDEKIQNFDLSLLNEDEICELMFHLKNKASNKNKNCNQKTMPSEKIQHNADAIKHKYHNVHKHEHTPFKMGYSPVGLRTIKNNGIHKSLRNDTTVIRKSRNYHNNDTETNKMSRTLFQDYLKVNNVTPVEHQNDRNVQQLHRNSLLRDGIPSKDSLTLNNKIKKRKSKNNLGYDLDPDYNNTKTTNKKKKWINGVISQSIGVIEENYEHKIKISDASIKSKIGKTVTYSTLNKYHHYVKDLESNPSIHSRAIEMGQCSGLCQQKCEVIEDTSSDDELSTDSESCDSENSLLAREKERNELISMLRKPSQRMLIKNWDENKDKESVTMLRKPSHRMINTNWDEDKDKESISSSSEATYESVVGRPLRSELRAQNQNRVAKISEFISNAVFPDTPNEKINNSLLIKLQSSLSISCNNIDDINESQISIDQPQKGQLAIELKRPVQNSSSQINQVDKGTVTLNNTVKKESKGIQASDVDLNEENKTVLNIIKKLESDKIKVSKSCEVNLSKVKKCTIPFEIKESKEIQVENEKVRTNILINVNKDKIKPTIDERDPYKKKLTMTKPIVRPEFKLSINPRPKEDKRQYTDSNAEKQYKDTADKNDSYFKQLETKKSCILSKIEENNKETSNLSSAAGSSTISTDSSRIDDKTSNFQENFEYKLNMINNKFKDIDTNETLNSPKFQKKCSSEKTPYSYRKNNENVNASKRFELESNMINSSYFKGFDTKEAFKLPNFERKTSAANNWYFFGGNNEKAQKIETPGSKLNITNNKNSKPVVDKVQSRNSHQYKDCVQVQKEVKYEFDKLFTNQNKSNKDLENEEKAEISRLSKISLIANKSSTTFNASKNENPSTGLSENYENIIEEIHECPLTYMYNNVPSVGLKNYKIGPTKKSVLKTYKRIINSEPLKIDKRNSIVINKYEKQVYIRTVKKISSSMVHEIFEKKSANVTLTNVFKRQKPSIREKTCELRSKIPIPVNRQNKPNTSDNSRNVISRIPIYKYKNDYTCQQASKGKNVNQKHKKLFLYYTVHSKTNCSKNTIKREINMSQTNTNDIKPEKVLSQKPNISKIPIIKQQKENTSKQFTSSNIKKESTFPTTNRTNNSISKNLQLLHALLPKPSLKIIHNKTKGRTNTKQPMPSERSPEMISKEKTNTKLLISAERSPKMITKEITNTKLSMPLEHSPEIISKEKTNTKLPIPAERSPKMITKEKTNTKLPILKEPPKIVKEENRLLPVAMSFNKLEGQVKKAKQKTANTNTINVQMKKDSTKEIPICNILSTNISPTEKTENKTTPEASNKAKVFSVDSSILNSYNSQIEKVNRKNENNVIPVESDIIHSYNSQIEKVKNKLTESTNEDSYPTTQSFYMPNDFEEEKCATEAGVSSCTFSDGGSGAIFIYKSKCKLESDNSFMDSEFESMFTSPSALNNTKTKKKWNWLKKFASKFKSFISFHSLKVNSERTSMTSGNTADTNVPNKKIRWSSISKLRNRKATSSSYTLSVKKKKPKKKLV